MFLLIDTDLKGLVPFFDYVSGLDDKPVLNLDDLPNGVTDYESEGSFHVVDIYNDAKSLSRWEQLVWASRGVRLFSNDFDEDSPIYAGAVPPEDKVRRAAVDATTAETRAGHMARYGVNYIGRTKYSPRNVFVLDNKKGNPLHDPAQDADLEALYASLPDDWWGSCGFVSSANIERLEAFLLSDDMRSVIPLGFTTGAFSKLNFMALDYVQVGVPKNDPKYGIDIRDRANRLSYKLSLEGYPEKEPEAPKDTSWLQL